MAELPTGTVTFLFTDIEDSTMLAQQYPDALPALLARHHAILREAIEAHHGHVFRIIGDAFCAAFPTALDALNAALEAQRGLQHEAWHQAPVEVRMGLHTGAAQAGVSEDRAGGYAGYSTLARTQRVMSIAHGGQVLLSNPTAELLRDQLPAEVALRDMREHRLKGLSQPEHLWQLVAPGIAIEFPPLKSLTTVPNNLPVQLTSFIGREKEIHEAKEKLLPSPAVGPSGMLREKFGGEGTRLLTLIGPGGTGKTRLSLQLATELLSHFADGVWFVELAPLADPALILQTIASVLGVRAQVGMPLMNIVVDYLRAKNLLLILDNCEHLVEASAQLADEFLHHAPLIKIIASSREALGIHGETVYRVPSLSLPQHDQTSREAVLGFESVRLFVERASAANSQFHLTDENASSVAQICSRLDGIPLAIELAASRVSAFSPEQIAKRLDDRFKLLTGGSRTALPRQQTLRALIDWSYDILGLPESRLLRRLSVFAGGWIFEAAEFVCSDMEVLELLPQLVNKSLVTMDDAVDEPRYRLLETIRQYAREKLLESGEAAEIRNRHLDITSA